MEICCETILCRWLPRSRTTLSCLRFRPIFLSAVVAYLPVPDLFNQALGVMARFLPLDSMGLVRRVLADVITPNRGTFLSFGILGSRWAASVEFRQPSKPVPRNTTGCNPCRGLLDWPLLSAWRLFSAFRKLQQNLRTSWSSHCADGLALLDWLCHAGGRRTQFRTSEDQQRGHG